MADVGTTYQNLYNPYEKPYSSPPTSAQVGYVYTPPTSTPVTTNTPYTVPTARTWNIEDAWKGIQGLGDVQRRAVMQQIFYAMQDPKNNIPYAKELYNRMWKQVTGYDYDPNTPGGGGGAGQNAWANWMLANSEMGNNGSYTYDPITGAMQGMQGAPTFYIDPSMLGYNQDTQLEGINKFYGGPEGMQKTFGSLIPEWQKASGNSAYLPFWYNGTRSDTNAANSAPVQPWNKYSGPSMYNAYTPYTDNQVRTTTTTTPAPVTGTPTETRGVSTPPVQQAVTTAQNDTSTVTPYTRASRLPYNDNSYDDPSSLDTPYSTKKRITPVGGTASNFTYGRPQAKGWNI